MCVGPTKMRAILVPKAFGIRAEAYFCLAFFVSFSAMEKKRRKNEITYPLVNMVAI